MSSHIIVFNMISYHLIVYNMMQSHIHSYEYVSYDNVSERHGSLPMAEALFGKFLGHLKRRSPGRASLLNQAKARAHPLNVLDLIGPAAFIARSWAARATTQKKIPEIRYRADTICQAIWHAKSTL